jgi:hypothetical protein
LAGGAAASAVVIGATAPPAQAFLPLLLRMAIGQGIREAIRERRLKRKGKGKQVSLVKAGRRSQRKLKVKSMRQRQFARSRGKS